ncbi:hypothetical protein NEPAR06_2250 [Nematocida parisii]|uniref:rRNA biogenesis protein RRP36 n=1 Tax=Nematocida parisii (strain ERTm3) TaxID=935791 RepID=I3EHZ6_NEMP3|nr:uncharacterized protein NEPG_02440 [Nematocida parisii ERTm1]EIJ88843.1 hypothetical protein NEQG_00662 [Nematocida parisii ERTm3]KAI5125856.1 hypothetical protein NEPAR03_0293 [Nematocida parisii]EIJ92749.1 hypothetical protein NEPG_02440 [Nematocida parisii ERTm1]KAI5129891.1 hypothetical protein NEPAR08_1772 [Nematocida parisii]KAI5142974.1 hypothetical protein NEPAR04_1714 [Nematocida parisii]|eukprot:XP_013060267.1 hypothetical protein NEPG_02440 [Nematocida parisii ERTm1]
MCRNKSTPQEVSSTARNRDRRHNPINPIKDPRFFNKEVNPIYLADNYSFLYDKEKEILKERQNKGDNVQKEMERIEARNKLLYVKRNEQQEKQKELERVKEGKKPFYISRKQAKVAQAMYTAQNKGAEYLINRLKKKQKERDNKSRSIYE